MKKNLCVVVMALLSILCGCNKEDNAPQEPLRHVMQTPPFSPFVDGQAIIEVDAAMAPKLERLGTKASINETVPELREAVKQIGGEVKIEPLYTIGGRFEKRHREAGLDRWYVIRYEGLPRPEILTILNNVTGVQTAEFRRKVKQNAIFNDPDFPLQWYLSNPGTPDKQYRAGADINVLPVWSNYECGSKEVIVAVEDSSPNMSNPDLKGVVLPAGPGGSKSMIDDIPYLSPMGHGTHVSGIIASINNNEEGICGIAGGNDGTGGVRIMSCQVFAADDSKSYQGGFENGFIWAADNGAVISQNSWGNIFDTEEEALSRTGTVLSPAIDYFIKYAGTDENGNQVGPMKGGVVIFSAGNENWRIAWPAAYEGDGKCLAVGAVSSLGTKAFYSNYGDWVDICAPGGDGQVGPQIYSCGYPDDYESKQGTSFACPMVSGVAALIVSHFGGPGFTNDMLVARLMGGTNKTFVPAGQKIGPLVDAYGSFTFGDTQAPEKVEHYQATILSNSIELLAKIPSDGGDVPPSNILALVSKDKNLLESSSPKETVQGIKKYAFPIGAEDKVGDTLSFKVSGLDFEETYYLCLCAMDYSSNVSEKSEIATIHTEGNHSPLIATEYSGDYAVKTHETLKVDFNITDPDQHKFTVEFDGGGKAATFVKNDDNWKLVIVGLDDEPGQYSAKILAIDEYKDTASVDVNYTILENHAPKITAPVGNFTFSSLMDTETIVLADHFTDDDGEAIKFSVDIADRKIVHLFVNSGNIIITPLDYGMTEATINASDCKETTKITIKILVRSDKTKFDVYPTSVSDHFYVRPAEDGTCDITVTGATGNVVYSCENAQAGPFEPLRINAKDFFGGLYQVNVNGEIHTIAKF